MTGGQLSVKTDLLKIIEGPIYFIKISVIATIKNEISLQKCTYYYMYKCTSLWFKYNTLQFINI